MLDTFPQWFWLTRRLKQDGATDWLPMLDLEITCQCDSGLCAERSDDLRLYLNSEYGRDPGLLLLLGEAQYRDFTTAEYKQKLCDAEDVMRAMSSTERDTQIDLLKRKLPKTVIQVRDVTNTVGPWKDAKNSRQGDTVLDYIQRELKLSAVDYEPSGIRTPRGWEHYTLHDGKQIRLLAIWD